MAQGGCGRSWARVSERSPPQPWDGSLPSGSRSPPGAAGGEDPPGVTVSDQHGLPQEAWPRGRAAERGPRGRVLSERPAPLRRGRGGSPESPTEAAGATSEPGLRGFSCTHVCESSWRALTVCSSNKVPTHPENGSPSASSPQEVVGGNSFRTTHNQRVLCASTWLRRLLG